MADRDPGFSDFPMTMLLVLAVISFCATSVSSDAACDAWGGIARQLTGNGRTQICVTNQTSNCARLDCEGVVRIAHPNLRFVKLKPISIDYCYGCQVSACSDPLSVDFYLQLPGYNNYTLKESVGNSEMVPLSNVKIPFGKMGSATPVLLFQMEKKPNGLISFSVICKVQLDLHGAKIFLPQLESTLIDEQTIPTPACSKGSNPDNQFVISACHAQKYPDAPTELPDLFPAVNPSTTLKKECNFLSKPCSTGEICDKQVCQCGPDFHLSPNKDACMTYSNLGHACQSLADCGFNEACVESIKDAKAYVCSCANGFGYDKVRQVCIVPTDSDKEGQSTTVSHKSKDSPDAGDHTDTGDKHHGDKHHGDDAVDDKDGISKFVIVGGAVGGVAVLFLVVMAVVCYKRRRRQVVVIDFSDSQRPLFNGMDNDDDMNLIM